MKSKQTSAQGFSLVELLVVIAIGAIVAVLSIGAYQQIMKSSVITGAAQTVIGALDQARQTAITRNSDVEVRLYQLPAFNGSPTDDPSTGQYRALQTFLITQTGTSATASTATPLTKVIFLPQPIVMQNKDASGGNYLANSSLLNTSLDTNMSFVLGGSTLAVTVPGYQYNYNTTAFRFTAKGGLNLNTTGQWFITLLGAYDKLGGNNFPPNYATIQVDPFTGRARFFRP